MQYSQANCTKVDNRDKTVFYKGVTAHGIHVVVYFKQRNTLSSVYILTTMQFDGT